MQRKYLLSQFLYLVDDLPGHTLIQHLLRWSHVHQHQQCPVGVGMVTGGEGVRDGIRYLQRASSEYNNMLTQPAELSWWLSW